MGRLIPAGTGLPRHRFMGIQIEGAEEGLEEAPAEEPAAVVAPSPEVGPGPSLMAAPAESEPAKDPNLDV